MVSKSKSEVVGKIIELINRNIEHEVTFKDCDEDITNIGIDSACFYTVFGDLEEWLGLEFPDAFLSTGASINQIADYVMQTVERQENRADAV